MVIGEKKIKQTIQGNQPTDKRKEGCYEKALKTAANML